MGEAARKLTASQARSAGPHLRLVPSRPRSSSRRRACARDSRALFRLFCVAISVLALVGLLRVTLAVQAQEAAIDANDLKRVIQAEEQMAKALEADRSALAAPSRIESIASAALNMQQPAEVCYINLPATTEPADGQSEPAEAAQKATPSGVAQVMSTVMDVAVGEAQVLLVGDVGIASAK